MTRINIKFKTVLMNSNEMQANFLYQEIQFLFSIQVSVDEVLDIDLCVIDHPWIIGNSCIREDCNVAF